MIKKTHKQLIYNNLNLEIMTKRANRIQNVVLISIFSIVLIAGILSNKGSNNKTSLYRVTAKIEQLASK